MVDDDDPTIAGEGSDMVNAETRMAHVELLRPDIATLDCGISHLFRRDWYVWMLADGVTGSSHRTGDDHFSVHLHGVLLITVLCSISFIFLILAVTSLLHLRPTILSRGIPVFFQNFLEFCQTLVPPSLKFIEISIA